jgi:hypothetical protein
MAKGRTPTIDLIKNVVSTTRPWPCNNSADVRLDPQLGHHLVNIYSTKLPSHEHFYLHRMTVFDDCRVIQHLMGRLPVEASHWVLETLC